MVSLKLTMEYLIVIVIGSCSGSGNYYELGLQAKFEPYCYYFPTTFYLCKHHSSLNMFFKITVQPKGSEK